MKRRQTERTPAEYLAMLRTELSDDEAASPADLTGLVAQLLAGAKGDVSEEDLAAYYDGALEPGDREAVQAVLAANPAALAELIALDEVLLAQAAAEEEGGGLSPEQAAWRQAGRREPLVPRSVGAAPHDGVWTLKPRDVAVDDVVPEDAPKTLVGRWAAAVRALLGRLRS